MQHGEWHCRPLARFGREIAQKHVESKDWSALDSFLWNAPHFTGDESKLTEDDKSAMFSLMIESPLAAMRAELSRGLELELSNPMLSQRTCSACRKWWFDPDTHLISMNSEGPILRPSNSALMCETNEGCPKGHHSNPIRLGEANQKAWRYYLEWSSVGLPETAKMCPVLRGNWRIIQRLVDTHGIPEICYRIL